MSLTTTSKSFKKGIKVLGLFALVYYLLILIVIPNTKEAILNAFVDRNPPNPKFGKLDALQFRPVELKNSNPEIVLDTKNGRLPAGIPKKMPVYVIKRPQYSYLAGQNAQKDAEVLGFTLEELASDLKGREYQWQSLTSGGFLTIDTETKSILLGTDLYGKNAEYKSGTIDYESAKTYMVELLRNIGRYNENLYKKENMRVALGQIIGSTLVKTDVVAQAQFARVDLYGKIGAYTVYAENPDRGIILGILRQPKTTNPAFNYPIFEGTFWDIDTSGDASYPIITVQEAWKQVQAGKGIITSVLPKNFNPFDSPPSQGVQKMLVNDIHMGYYITSTFQKHLQPIYIFKGNYTAGGSNGGSFYIYYPAITAEFTNPAPAPIPEPQQ